MNRIDSLLLLHRRLDGDDHDGETAASTSARTAEEFPFDSISTLNSVREEDYEDYCGEEDSSDQETTAGEEDPNSDLVVGFPSVPRRSSEALRSVPARLSSLRSSSSLVKAQNYGTSSQHKSVRFVLPEEDPLAIHYIDSAIDMSPKEISDLWITAAERAEINRRNKETVKGMRRSRSENDLNHLGQSSRGLEHLQSSRILRALAQAQRDLIDAVLHLQSVQRKNQSIYRQTQHHHAQEEEFARDLALLARQMAQSARNRAIETAEADAATAAFIAAMELRAAEEGQAPTRVTTSRSGSDRRRRHSGVTLLPSIPQEGPWACLPTISTTTAASPSAAANHAVTRQAYLANLQETLELSAYDARTAATSDDRSVASSFQGDAATVGSHDSPLCF